MGVLFVPCVISPFTDVFVTDGISSGTITIELTFSFVCWKRRQIRPSHLASKKHGKGQAECCGQSSHRNEFSGFGISV